MIGIGTANLAAGLFQGFPVSTSGSRTAVAERAGAKSQLTGVTGALMIAAMLLFVPGLFRNLPQPVLASVVITASLSLADIPGTVRLWKQRRMEFVVSMVAFAGVAHPRRPARHRRRGPHLDPERVPEDVDAVSGGARSSRRAAGLPRPSSPSRGRDHRRPRPLPLRRAAALRQRPHVPRRDPADRRLRSTSHVDRRGGGTDHRHRHHRGRHARGPRRGAQRPRDLPGVRGDEDAGAAEGPTLRAHPDHRSRALLRHGRGKPSMRSPRSTGPPPGGTT